MSDSLRQGNDSKAAVLILGAGLVSGILYSSAIFSLAFLIPVQVAFGRRGFWTGLAAAGAALVASVAGELVPILISGGLSALSGGELGLGSAQFLLLAILPPAVLLAALILMNLPFWTGRAGFARGFAGTALASLVAIPGLYALSRDGGFLPYFEERLKAYIEPVLAQAGSGVDASALRAAFDVKVIAQTSVTILYCSFAALLLLWLAGSRWLGNRLSGTGSLGRQEAKSLSDFRLPYLLVWPFLVAWTGVLGVSYFKLGMPAKAVAWNLALVLSLAYTAQGLGIASHFMRRWNLPRALRICLGVTALLLFATPPFGTALTGLVPLLGVTEVWIPYRNPKGVRA